MANLNGEKTISNIHNYDDYITDVESNYTSYPSWLEMYHIVIGNQYELYETIDTLIEEDPNLENILPICIQLLYKYHITGKKLQKLWSNACNQNSDIFKLTLFLLSSYDCRFQDRQEKTVDEQKLDYMLLKCIKQNMELDEPIPFIEDTTFENYHHILTDTENWNDYCTKQANYLIESLSEKKKYTR